MKFTVSPPRLSAALILPVLLLLVGASAPLPDVPSAPPASALPRIALDKITLPNGLELIMVEDHKLPIVAVNLWYHVGPANEAPGLTGFAHLFEHMMFAGTKHLPRGMSDQLLEGAGATDSNGSTDFDRTNYYDTVPSNQLELALWAHSDRMGYLLDVLDQKGLAIQQDVVRNERRQTIENTPYGIVSEALVHLMLPREHPYYASVMGSHADIQNAKLGDIRAFFKRYYVPNNASLVIAGDIDKASTRALVAKYFGSFKRGPRLERPSVPTPPITAERRAVVTDRVELARVFMGWLSAPAFKPGDAELAVAAQVLGGGKSSRLYKALVYDKQIAQDVSAAQNANALTSMFVVDATARPGHSAQEIEAAIDAELQALRSTGPSEKEVERARNSIETAMLTSIEKLGGTGLANQLNQYNQYVGDPAYLGEDIARIRRVSAADVQRVMIAQLRSDARAVVHGIPGKQELAPEVPTPPLPKGRLAAPEAVNVEQAWRRHVPKAGPAPAIALPRASTFTLANGLTVIHHDNPTLPLVSADLVIKSGAQANPLERPGLASFTADMLDEGSSTRSSPQIADDFAQLGSAIDIASGADSSRLAVLALKDHFAGALALLADVARNPAFPAAEVERQRSSRIGDLSQLRENAASVATVAAAGALYGDHHPLGYGELGTRAAIEATSRADLQAFWQRHYLPNNAALVVAGDIRAADLKVLAERVFGSWRSGPVPTPAAAVPAPTRARLVLVDKPGTPQTALRVTTLGPARQTPDFAALEVMNAALGGLFTSRLNNNLREQKGYTYGVGSQFIYHRSAGPFAISGSVRTDVTGAALAEVFKEVRGMRARAMTPAELSQARNSQILSLPGLFDSDRSIAYSLAGTYVYDLGLDYYSGLAQRFASVTSAQVQAVAKQYLVPERLIVVGVGDRAKIDAQLSRLKLGAPEVRDEDGTLRAGAHADGTHADGVPRNATRPDDK
ncbi:MAG: pitrilysin family protein [Pseudomonadota bacterium]